MVRPAIWSDTNKFLWATDKNGDSTDIGFMVRPAIWSDTNKFLWATDKNGDSTDIGCGNFDLPDDTEFEINNGNKLDCQQWWSTVGTEIPGEANFLIEKIRPDIDCSEENTEKLHQKFPW